MSWANRWCAILLLLMVIVLVAGCSFGQPEVTAKLQAAHFINPNIYNQASPVVVSLYQLKSAEKFKQASFFQLSTAPTEVLASELIDKQELEIEPDKTAFLVAKLQPDTHYVGLVAWFRTVNGDHWKALLPVKANKSVTISASINNLGITLHP
jgi:type VI secretion system protein VasD